ncbi:MAG: hypothetical protein ACNS61_15310 [Candidatus Wenzhouxiangella sp. M2_3B_020]
MTRLDEAARLMDGFAARTGIDDGPARRRYLWTDAFAVGSFIGLAETGDANAMRRARDLVARVHEVLGAYADDGTRPRWLGRVDDAAHRRSPTAAGLRIGKTMPERGPGEPFDERAEWDRDGQYFHYLARWMHVLERMAETTGEAEYHRWAFELSVVAFDAFVKRDRDGRPIRMFWKMSIDLDRPLVSSMGQHDPVDGWITSRQLAASAFADDAQKVQLHEQGQVYAALARRMEWATADPLGTGGMLCSAWCLWRSERGADPDPVARLLESSVPGMEHVSRQRLLKFDPGQRLGFRELGLAIGLHAAKFLADDAGRFPGSDAARRRLLEALDPWRRASKTAERIEATWLEPRHRRLPAWTEHQDINDVMLATSLAPAGYLGRAPAARSRTEGNRGSER